MYTKYAGARFDQNNKLYREEQKFSKANIIVWYHNIATRSFENKMLLDVKKMDISSVKTSVTKSNNLRKTRM